MKQRRNVRRMGAWNCMGRLLVAGCFAVAAVFLLGLIVPDTTNAATTPPNKMNFQGRLTDASGNPLAGTYDMQFKLYSAVSGGTLLWAETRTAANSNPVTVTSGLFSVRLGDGTLTAPSTQLSAVVAANPTLYFEITVGADAPMIPRSQLASSAYAFNSDTLDGIDSSGFIQNTTTVQTATNMAIDGSARADTSILTPTVDTNTAVALNIGTTNATAINLNKDVTVAAGKTLTLAGDTRSNITTNITSPTEGMMVYDTTNHRLLTYSNGKWQADRSTSTKIVAASNASQALKDGADYVATGTGDQTTINTALTAAAGGRVYLTEGTYTVNAAISIPNNTTIGGAGSGTVITVANAFNTTINAITNATAGGNGTGIVIQDLRLEGNNTNQTAGTMTAIYFNGVGSGSGSTAVQGGKITNVWANNWRNSGISLSASSNSAITGVTVQGNTSDGVTITTGSVNNSLSGSTIQGNGASGVYVASSTTTNNTFTGNTAQGNNNAGFYFNTTSANSLTGNAIQGNNYGVYLYVTANNNVITGNSIANSGGSATNNAIFLNAADSNTITGNSITDSSATTNYAINISNSTSDTNYLASNTLNGGSINDLGTGTVYGGQVDVSSNYILQPAGNVTLQAGVVVAGLGSGEATLLVNGGSTGSQRISFETAGSTTWSMGAIGGGANPTFNIQRMNSGTYVDAPLSISNSTGLVSLLNTSITGTLTMVNSSITNDTSALSLTISTGPTDPTLGKLGLSVGTHPSATGSNRYAYIGTGDAAAMRDLVLNSNGVGQYGGVVIGTTSSAGYILNVQGGSVRFQSGSGATCTLTTSWSCTSDATQKNIEGNVTNNLSRVMKLQPVYFTWKADTSKSMQIGLTAQDVQEQYPELVTTNNDGTLSLNYQGLVAPLIGAVQEQQTEIDGVKASIADLQASRSAGASLSASSLDAAPSAALTIGGTNATAVNIGRTTENIVTTITGTTIIKPSGGHNSTNVFQVQNAASSSLFTVDSTNNRLYIGSISGDTTGVTLVLGNKTTAGDPSGVDGAMYYNSYMGAFRCYSNGAWSNCGDDNIDSSWKTEEEFMSGQPVNGDSLGNGAMTWATGSLNWAYMKIGSGGTSGFSYNPTITGLTTTANHPGLGVFSSASSNVGANIALDGGSDGSLATTQDTTFKVQLHNSHSAGFVERTGLFDYQPNLSVPSSGTWWEADPAASPYWRYCYNNTATQVCADSTVLISQSSATDGWVKLEIRTGKVAITGNVSSVAFYINGSLAANLTGINIQKDGHDAPNVTFYSTDSISKQLAVDYVQARGTISR